MGLFDGLFKSSKKTKSRNPVSVKKEVFKNNEKKLINKEDLIESIERLNDRGTPFADSFMRMVSSINEDTKINILELASDLSIREENTEEGILFKFSDKSATIYNKEKGFIRAKKTKKQEKLDNLVEKISKENILDEIKPDSIQEIENEDIERDFISELEEEVKNAIKEDLENKRSKTKKSRFKKRA